MNSEAPARTMWGHVGMSIPSVDSSPGIMLLPFVLGFVAGSVDVIGFLGLDGLFTAHITGNLVLLAAHIVTGGVAGLAPMLSIPVFMVALALAAGGFWAAYILLNAPHVLAAIEACAAARVTQIIESTLIARMRSQSPGATSSAGWPPANQPIGTAAPPGTTVLT